jgi:hypothetical protein
MGLGRLARIQKHLLHGFQLGHIDARPHSEGPTRCQYRDAFVFRVRVWKNDVACVMVNADCEGLAWLFHVADDFIDPLLSMDLGHRCDAAAGKYLRVSVSSVIGRHRHRALNSVLDEIMGSPTSHSFIVRRWRFARKRKLTSVACCQTVPVWITALELGLHGAVVAPHPVDLLCTRTWGIA